VTIFLQAVGFGVIIASITAIGAMGFTLQFGVTNVFNLNYASVMTVCAFIAYLLQSRGVSIWLCMLTGGVAGAILTYLIGRTVLRAYARRGVQIFEVVMAMLGLSTVLSYVVYVLTKDNIYEFSFSPGRTLHLGPFQATITQLILLGLAVLALLAMEGLLRLTRFGTAVRAMSAERDLAAACGISVNRVVAATWLITGFLCGIAGVAYVVDSMTVSYLTGSLFLPLVLSAAMLGGVGSPVGACLAALAMGIVTEVVAAYGGSAYSTTAAFGVLVIVLLSRPSALLSAGALRRTITV
jgi:branched-subunit amino acid ABC-type transport system permease component